MVRRRRFTRQYLAIAAFAVAALVLGGCDWATFGYDATHAGSSPDTAMNSANVSTVRPLFTVPAQSDPLIPGQFGPPVESNGVVYVGNTSAGDTSGNLEAFDANGATNCSGLPNRCSPLWTGSIGPDAAGLGDGSAPAVANGVVYIASTQSSASTIPPTLYAFDAGGTIACSGAPKICRPLWTAPLSTGDVHVESPSVINGVVYVSGYQSPGPPPNGPTGTVEAFDANGVTHCSGTPKVCQPLWTTASDIGYSAPAVANGILYAVGEDTLDAFSANGSTNCAGTPTTCVPLWTANLDTSPTYVSTVSPAVSGGVVYAQSANFNLEAFDANGVTNCLGAPKTCTPLWSATETGLDGVANGIVYGLTDANDALSAFDARGVTNCSGTPKTCTPLWSYSLAGLIGPVSVANGLVYYSSSFCAAACSSDPGFDFEAFDANGVTQCSGMPKVCQPLWTGLEASSPEGSPAIANGKLYVGEGSWLYSSSSYAGGLQAWVLPPPTTTVVKPSNNSTVTGSQGLDALASSGVTQVQYELTGGTFNRTVIANGAPTIDGWTSTWNTTTVPNGVYTLQSVASYGGEVSGTSPGITIKVSN